MYRTFQWYCVVPLFLIHTSTQHSQFVTLSNLLLPQVYFQNTPYLFSHSPFHSIQNMSFPFNWTIMSGAKLFIKNLFVQPQRYYIPPFCIQFHTHKYNKTLDCVRTAELGVLWCKLPPTVLLNYISHSTHFVLFYFVSLYYIDILLKTKMMKPSNEYESF